MFAARSIIEGTDDELEMMRLMETAFPPNEQATLEFLTTQAKRDEVSLLAYRDEKRFCGFAFMIEGTDLVYVLYLAVDETLRSKGYGARMLADIEQRFPGKTITLDIEPVEEPAPNVVQRKKRRGFYLRNGFIPTGWINCCGDDRFEVFAKGPDFEPNCFLSLINELPEGPDKTLARAD